jgi:hypothetical protein
MRAYTLVQAAGICRHAILCKLGRDKEANAILFPMLKAFKAGGFQGRGPNGKTYDWTAGTEHLSLAKTPSGLSLFCFL